MRITTDKNLAFRDQPTPLDIKGLTKEFPNRAAEQKAGPARLELSHLVSTVGKPKVELSMEPGAARGSYDLRLHVENHRIGQHVFPSPPELQQVEFLGDRGGRIKEPLQSTAEYPAHLALRTRPSALARGLQREAQIDAAQFAVGESGNQATTVFAPENRFVFNDTSYPWSACGRVDTPGGFGSGVMVGPRHMLTVSHVIQWLSGGGAGWVRFRPMVFDGSAPFGEAWGTWVYYKSKVTGPTIDWFEGQYDYVCVVLNNNIGNLTGWMGARGYTDGWDGGNYWSHIGYPGDLTGGNRPTFEGSISLDGSFWQFDSHEAMSHRGDVWPGQSGGPFFGWWSGDVGPRAVAVQSSQNSSENNASGGQDLVDLIIRARSDHP
jgi:V8-like Glu-specific endopeptidase